MKELFKNKKGAIATIWMVIAVVAFISIFVMASQGYIGFMNNNNGIYDSNFTSHYNNITSKYAYYDTQAANQSAGAVNDALTLKDLFFSGLNLFITSIRKLGSGALMSRDIFNSLGDAIPGIGLLISFLVVTAGLYIGYKIIQNLRGQVSEI